MLEVRVVPSSLMFCLVAFGVCLVGQAQPGGQDITQLREQIRLLQQQLDQMATPGVTEQRRVTSLGDESTRRSKRERTIVMRVYDLSDLFAVAPHYPARFPDDFAGSMVELFPNDFLAGGDSMRGGGGLGGGAFNVPPDFGSSRKPSDSDQRPAPDRFRNSSLVTPQDSVMTGAQVTMNNLVDVIQETVSSEDWDSQGGDSKIAILGNSLIVSCYPSMHEKIEELFELFRKKWGTLRTVSVQAIWCWATPQQVNSILQKSSELKEGALNRGVGVVDAGRWGEFVKELNDNKRVAYAAAITSHNGQMVHTLSGEQVSYVANVRPIVKGEERPVVAYEPRVRSLQQGAALQITPVATRGGNFVIMDVHSRVNELTAKKTTKLSDNGMLGALEPDFIRAVTTPSFNTHRLSTTVRMPNNSVVLVGGMTFESAEHNQQPELYLFMRATIHNVVLDEN